MPLAILILILESQVDRIQFPASLKDLVETTLAGLGTLQLPHFS